MGIKFQNYEEEIDILSFTQSTIATQLNYSVVENQRQHKRTNQFSMEAVTPLHKLVNNIGKGKNNIGR